MCYLLWESKKHPVTEMQNFLKLEHLVHDSITGLQIVNKSNNFVISAKWSSKFRI